jgi:hypothetical protein
VAFFFELARRRKVFGLSASSACSSQLLFFRQQSEMRLEELHPGEGPSRAREFEAAGRERTLSYLMLLLARPSSLRWKEVDPFQKVMLATDMLVGQQQY